MKKKSLNKACFHQRIFVYFFGIMALNDLEKVNNIQILSSSNRRLVGHEAWPTDLTPLFS